jgi:hypothetical protein
MWCLSLLGVMGSPLPWWWEPPFDYPALTKVLLDLK